MTSTMADTASDYGSFGSDDEEIDILDQLLAKITSPSDEQNVALIVTDIEDYEEPQGILLPAHLQPEIEILRNIEAESSTCYHFDASIC